MITSYFMSIELSTESQLEKPWTAANQLVLALLFFWVLFYSIKYNTIIVEEKAKP